MDTSAPPDNVISLDQYRVAQFLEWVDACAADYDRSVKLGNGGSFVAAIALADQFAEQLELLVSCGKYCADEALEYLSELFAEVS